MTVPAKGEKGKTMKYKLINIGRDKINREVEVEYPAQIFGEVKKHLMSHNVELITDDDGELFRIYAGYRRVGTVERIDNVHNLFTKN